MQGERPGTTYETTNLIHCPSHVPCDTAASYVYTSRNYHEFDEAENWIELESKTRSVRYHLSECIQYQSRHEDADIATLIDDQSEAEATSSQQRSDYTVTNDNEATSRNRWRLKVASDMALSGLSAMEHILDMLRIYRNGRASASIFRDLANWFFLMSASYAIRTLHYSPPIDTTADATLLVSGCLALRSTCQLFHIGIRSLVINRCQNIVISLMFRVLSGDVDRQDVESLHGYWFRGLSMFRVEERISLPVEREFRPSCGYFAQKPLPTPGYVIPDDS